MCTPRRTRNGKLTSACCTATAHAIASRARAKAATNESPSPCSTGRTPSKRPTSSSTNLLSSTIAASVVFGSDSHPRVEPSTSANSSVTVPVGNTKSPTVTDGSPQRNGRNNTGTGRFSLTTPPSTIVDSQKIRHPGFAKRGQEAPPCAGHHVRGAGSG